MRFSGIVKTALLDEDESTFYREVRSLRDLSLARIHWVEENPLPSLLHYEDRNSMAFSIETRLPFLDYRLVNIAFGLPAEWMSEKGWTKFICRQGMKGLVPEEVRWRRDKVGFPAPTSGFLRTFCTKFKQILSDQFRSGRYIDASALLKALDSPEPPEFLWRAISLEIWMKVMDVM
jgi:asparagine synthase (glutamine-hydrolysing)